MAGLLDALVGSNDPATADPNTGLVEAQKRQLLFNTLGNTGALLLAAGQNIMPSQQAQLLSQLGNVPAQTQQMSTEMSQQNLLAQRNIAAQRQNTQQADLLKYIHTPEFQQQFESLPQSTKALAMAQIKGGDLTGMIKTIQEARVQTQPMNLGGGNIGYRQADGGWLILNPQTETQHRIGPDGKMQQAQYNSGATVDPNDMAINPDTGFRDNWVSKLNRPPGYPEMLKRAANGDLDVRTISMRDPLRTLLIRDLPTYAPGAPELGLDPWNEQAYASKKKMQESVNPGGQLYKTIIFPGQRTINHTANLVDVLPKLDLWDNYMGTLGGNALKLLNMKKEGGDAANLVTYAEENLQTAKDEWAKYLHGTGNLTVDAQRRMDHLTLSDGPGAIKGFAKWVTEGMKEQMSPLQNDYRRQMRNPRAGLSDLIGKDVEEKYAKVQNWANPAPQPSAQQGAAPQAAPAQQGAIPQQRAGLAQQLNQPLPPPPEARAATGFHIPTPQDIAALKANPALRPRFEKAFGPDATASILGR